MHILHINLAKGFRGGERQTALLIAKLAHYGIKQTLACRRDSPLREMLADVDVSFLTVGHPLWRWWGHHPGVLIHAHETKGAYWAWFNHRIYRTPYIITRRVDHPIKDSKKHRALYGQAAAVVAISRIIDQQLAPYNPNRHIIPSAHQAQAVPAPDPELQKIADQRWLIGHVGALVDAHKGQSLLIEAIAEHPGWALVLVGDGKDQRHLRDKASENVHFCGHVENVLPYLSAFNVFAFPSRYEGLGSTLIDAMQLGKPIVASDVGGIPDLIRDGENGLLIPPNDPRALTDALLRLYQNPALAAQLGEQARLDANRYSPTTMAESYLQLYRELCP